MGVTVDHLVGNAASDIGEGEQPGFLGDPRLEDDLQQQIAELVADIVDIAALHGIRHLVGLFDGVGRDRREVLLDIPGAAGFRITQLPHDFDDALELVQFVLVGIAA